MNLMISRYHELKSHPVYIANGLAMFVAFFWLRVVFYTYTVSDWFFYQWKMSVIEVR
jgi:hypothetical protein